MLVLHTLSNIKKIMEYTTLLFAGSITSVNSHLFFVEPQRIIFLFPPFQYVLHFDKHSKGKNK